MFKRLSAVILLSTVAAAGYSQSTYGGQYAAKLTNTTPGAFTGDIGLDLGNDVAQVTPGSNVVLKFALKSGNLGPSIVNRVSIACFQGKDANGPTGFITDLNMVAGTTVQRAWQEFSFAHTLPANANYVSIGFRADAGGSSLLIDSVSLALASAPNANLLPNGGFDTWTGAATSDPDGWRFFAVAGAAGTIGRLAQLAPVGTLPQMQNIFKVNAGTSVTQGSLAWFNGDGADIQNTRGMTFNPQSGNLLVVDRSSNPVGNVYALNAATGSEVATFNVDSSVVTGGTFVVNKVGVDGTGRVFVANLAVAGQPFKVYMYPSEAAAATQPPTVAYQVASSSPRYGDDFAVTGSGANTRLLVGSRNTDSILILEDPDNDGTFTATADSRTVVGVNGPSNVAFDPESGKYWYHQSLSTIRQMDYELLPYNLNGTPSGSPVPLSIGYVTGPIAVAQIGQKLIGIGPAEAENPSVNSTNIRGYIYSIGLDGTGTPLFQTGNLGLGGTWYPNGNGAGDVAFDTANRRIYFLATNNSISGWQLPAVPNAAQDWQHLQ